MTILERIQEEAAGLEMDARTLSRHGMYHGATRKQGMADALKWVLKIMDPAEPVRPEMLFRIRELEMSVAQKSFQTKP